MLNKCTSNTGTYEYYIPTAIIEGNISETGIPILHHRAGSYANLRCLHPQLGAA